MKTVILPTISSPRVMCHFNVGKARRIFYIAKIDESVEELIEDKNVDTISLLINEKVVKIPKTNIYFYGEMDFKTGGEDYETIKYNDNLFAGHSSVIPANYNYANHSYSYNDSYKVWETFRPELIVQYFHGLLGKPKRCVIFKRII